MGIIDARKTIKLVHVRHGEENEGNNYSRDTTDNNKIPCLEGPGAFIMIELEMELKI
jgi:hypothetical protein